MFSQDLRSKRSPIAIWPVSAIGERSWQLGLALFLIGAAIWLAYRNSLEAPFVFDDIPAITDNPSIRNVVTALFPSREIRQKLSGLPVDGRPLVNLSLALSYAQGGLAARSYRLHNLMIHLCVSWVLFGIIQRTLQRPRLQGRFGSHAGCIAFVAVLLWALHPLQTGAVTYVAQRAETLMALCYLLTLYGFIRSVESPADRWWQAGSGLACGLGMLAKEVMVSAPLMVLLYDRLLVSSSFRSAWSERRWFYSGLAATWLLLAWLVAGTGGRGGTAGFSTDVTWWEYACTQAPAVVHYLRLAVWPHPLIFDYGALLETRGAVVLPAAMVVMLLVAGTMIALRRASPAALLGAWFLLLLAPTSSVVPVATQTVAEHRMYLPLAAITLGVALAGFRRLGLWGLAGLLAAGVALGTATAARNGDYATAVALWRDTVAKRPANPRAHYNLGVALFLAGECDAAIASYRAALALKPDYGEAHYNLANACIADSRRQSEAVRHYEAALAVEPRYANYADLQRNLALALTAIGRRGEALGHMKSAIDLQPDSALLWCDLGDIIGPDGDLAEATRSYEEAIRLDPAFAKAYNNLGAVLAWSGRRSEAMMRFEAALAIAPNYAEAHNNLANVLVRVDRTGEAMRHYEDALRIDPDYAEAHNNLGMLLAGLGDRRGAEKHFECALQLRPDFDRAADNLRRLRSTDLEGGFLSPKN